jgi:hypothetical protein
MGRAQTGAPVGRAQRYGAVRKAPKSPWGRAHHLSDYLGWRACRRDGRRGRVTAGCAPGPHAQLTRVCGFVPPLARAGGGGYARR